MAHNITHTKKKKLPNVNERILRERVRKARELLRDVQHDLWLYKYDFKKYMKKQQDRSINSVVSPRLRMLLNQLRQNQQNTP